MISVWFKTTPMHTDWASIRDVWQEADQTAWTRRTRPNRVLSASRAK